MVIGIVYLGLSKVLSKEESLELDSELRMSVDILQLLTNATTDRAMKLKERSPTDFRLCFEIFKSFSLEDRRVREVWYVQSEGKTGV